MPDTCKSANKYTEYCLGIELSDQFLEIGKTIYLGVQQEIEGVQLTVCHRKDQ